MAGTVQLNGGLSGSVLGLSEAEAAARLARDGPNRLTPEARGGRVKRVLGPLSDPMVALLAVAAFTYLLIGDTTDAVVAFVALGPIATVGWLLEARAERTLDQLRRRVAPTAIAVRGGRERELLSEDLVVGDAVRLREGDIVPADATVLELTQLLVDESALTGESLPVVKVAGGDTEDAKVWAGTTVVSGRAVIRVDATGAATRYGSLGALVAGVRQPPTPLQRGLARLVRALVVVALAFCVAVIGAELLHGDGWGQALIAGVSLAIAAIPEEFSMVYTLYLALGAWRLAQQHALVRRLPSVETLGSTTVICADKTGTLTEGRLAVDGLWTPSSVSGDSALRRSEATALLEAAVLACEPQPFDLLDIAVVDYARRCGIDTERLHQGLLLADWPFDPADRYLSHLWYHPEGGYVIAAKGSIEGLLRRIAAEEHVRAPALAANDALAASGMRVIAIAGGSEGPPSGSRERDESALRFLGLVAFSDPIRTGVAEALAACREAGIRVIMITGDHPTTAHAVAEGLDLPHESGGVDVIATGDDLGASPSRAEELALSANVFARTRPEQKHLLVEALRRHGEVVAMTGDGINDAAALREADIGVAMGERGTEVARSAASLVLLDDNFATIVDAVRDGRRIFDNLTRAFAYLVAFHPPLLLAALVIPLIGKPLLLLPVHLVLLELLLHPIVSLVFQADPADADVMRRPPRPVGDALRLRALWRPYAVGTVLATVIVVEYLVVLAAGWPAEQARALGLASLLAAQPLLLLSMRSPNRPVWSSGRPWSPTLTIVIVAVVITTVAVVELRPLADLLRVEAFPPPSWLLVILAGATTLWSEPLKGRVWSAG